jgi:hypothetical protein
MDGTEQITPGPEHIKFDEHVHVVVKAGNNNASHTQLPVSREQGSHINSLCHRFLPSIHIMSPCFFAKKIPHDNQHGKGTWGGCKQLAPLIFRIASEH